MRRFLESSRYLALVIVAASFITMILVLIWGLLKLVGIPYLIFSSGGADPAIIVSVLALLEVFLTAVILFIFSVSIYELFIGDLSLPDWMVAHNLHDLKGRLGGVIILVMAVKFLEVMVSAKNYLDLLFLGIAVAVVSGVLIAFTRFGEKD